MDDDYKLIPKAEFEELKAENKRLKEELESSKNNSIKENKDDLSKEILKLIDSKLSQENSELKKTLNDIKELNKKTLNNVLVKTDSMNQRVEDLISTFKELVSSIAILNEEVSKSDNSDIIEKLDSINNEEISQKLDSIQEFMDNLKFLLSQVKKIE